MAVAPALWPVGRGQRTRGHLPQVCPKLVSEGACGHRSGPVGRRYRMPLDRRYGASSDRSVAFPALAARTCRDTFSVLDTQEVAGSIPARPTFQGPRCRSGALLRPTSCPSSVWNGTDRNRSHPSRPRQSSVCSAPGMVATVDGTRGVAPDEPPGLGVGGLLGARDRCRRGAASVPAASVRSRTHRQRVHSEERPHRHPVEDAGAVVAAEGRSFGSLPIRPAQVR